MNKLKLAYGVFNCRWPEGNPLALTIPLDFSSVPKITDDLLLENTGGQMPFVQSVYVDNSDNANPFELFIPVTRQRLVVPAYAQGTYPLFAPDQTQFEASTTPAPGLEVGLIFLNIPLAYNQWGPIDVTVQNVNASFTPVVGSYTDFSGVGTGASASAIPANPTRKQLVISNPADTGVNPNGDSLYINFGAAASISDSMEILPGGSYNSQTGPVSGEEIFILAANGVPYVAKEMQ